jgi:primosomal protein N' (replication factor Y)
VILQYAEVAVDSPAGKAATFCYSIPDHIKLSLGHSVIVPFGQQLLQGIVFDITNLPSVEKTKEIIQLTEIEPLVDSHRLILAKWISNNLFCTLFEAVSLMLPPGGRYKFVTWLSSNKINKEYADVLSPFQSKILFFIENHNRISMDKVIAKFGYKSRLSVNLLINKGIINKDQILKPPSVNHKYEFLLTCSDKGSKSVNENQLTKAPKQAKLITFLLSQEINKVDVTDREVRNLFGSSVLTAIIKKGYVEIEKRRIYRDPLKNQIYIEKLTLSLVPEQVNALNLITKMLDNPKNNPKALLLHGVTGSGKTEVYIEAVKYCLSLGKTAIVLVPEIALTPQTIERFESHFKGQVGIYHSGLSAGERFDEWWKIKHHKYSIVIGSRSALFVPQSNLGIIIIDEEHDWNYKQTEGSPKYQVKDIVMQIAGMMDAIVVMGSASPDVESYYRAVNGRYKLATLNDRYKPTLRIRESSSNLADIDIVDMRDELTEGNPDIFSRILIKRLDKTIANGEQAILFLNRRGSASNVQCRICGFIFRCKKCDVFMTFHRDRNILLCHYCGQKQKEPEICPDCQSSSIGQYGVGTQLVEQRIKLLYPNVNVLRWDRDVVRYKKDYEEILNSFRSGDNQVLVATQVIAKGHHLPNVTLVGVILADIGLGIPDFRSPERNFQVLCQVAGRSGRGKKKGQVIIQTFQPNHYSIINAAKQNYENFYNIELEHRRTFAYPPYSKLIRLMKQDLNNANCEKDAVLLSVLLRKQQQEWGLSDTDVIGPTPAFPSKVRGFYRWQIILRGPTPKKLLDKIDLNPYKNPVGHIQKGWSVDVNPVLS